MNNETATEQKEKFPGFVTPTKNFFHMPNCWLDICADINNLAELKVVQYVLRHTWGFHEYGIAKAITIDEFMNGRKRGDGTRIDKGTGLAKKSVIDGLQKAINHHYLECEIDDADKGRIKKSYKLKMLKASTDEPEVQVLNICGSSSEHLDTTSLTSEVQEVNSRGLDTEHRTEKDTIETNSRKTPKKESAAPAVASPSSQKAPSQDSLLEAPLTEPPMNGSWNHEKAVQYAEWCNGKRYSAKMREAQLKAAQTLHKGDSSLTLEQFKQAYDERNDAWWKEHKGRLDVTDMKAKEQSSGVVRIYAMLERTQQHKAKPSLQVVAPNKEQERPSVLVPKRQSLINFMNLFINAGSVPESYLNKFNDAQAEGIDLPLDKLERVRSLPIQAVRSNAL